MIIKNLFKLISKIASPLSNIKLSDFIKFFILLTLFAIGVSTPVSKISKLNRQKYFYLNIF